MSSAVVILYYIVLTTSLWCVIGNVNAIVSCTLVDVATSLSCLALVQGPSPLLLSGFLSAIQPYTHHGGHLLCWFNIENDDCQQAYHSTNITRHNQAIDFCHYAYNSTTITQYYRITNNSGDTKKRTCKTYQSEHHTMKTLTLTLCLPFHSTISSSAISSMKLKADKHEVADRICTVVKNFQKVDPAKVTPNAHSQNDLGLDSLDTVDIVMALEEEFGCEIPDNEADKINFTGLAVDFMASHPQAK